jgi:hypothetical protein
MIHSRWRWIAPPMVALAATAAIVVPPLAAASGPGACPAGVQVAQHVVDGAMAGETACDILSQSAQVDQLGRAWTQVDLGFDGTISGESDSDTVGGAARKDITDVPTVLFPQFGIPAWQHALGTYSGTAPVAGQPASDTGISVFYPTRRSTWNGKAVLVMHGQSENTPVGALDIGARDGALPAGTFGNLFVPEWLKLGYAVIYVRRPASNGVPAVLADGRHVDESANDSIAFGLDMLASGLALLRTVGYVPSETEEYGHSAGTIWARLLNYSGLNTLPNGRHLITGIVADDPGGGLPEPLSMPQGQLLGERGTQITYPTSALLPRAIVAQEVPQLSLLHEDYQATHVWLKRTIFTDLKLAEPVIAAREHAGDVTRDYELAGVSHISNQAGSPPMTLDYGPEAMSLMVTLQRWVDHQGAPVASIVNKPGQDALSHQVLIPATACPTGIRYPWPAPVGAPSETGYAAFGSGLEPVNSQGEFVDVGPDGNITDGDGVRDTLPSMASVWADRHLPTTHGRVTTADMVACVRADTAALAREGMLSEPERANYLALAGQFPATISW